MMGENDPKIEVLDKEGNQWRLALYLWYDVVGDGPMINPPDIRLEHICPDTRYEWHPPSMDIGCSKCGPIPDKLMDKYRLMKNDDEPEELQEKIIITASEYAVLGDHRPHNGVRVSGVDPATKVLTIESIRSLKKSLTTIRGPNGRLITSTSSAIAQMSSKPFPAWIEDDLHLIATDKAMPKNRLDITDNDKLGMFPAWMMVAGDAWLE